MPKTKEATRADIHRSDWMNAEEVPRAGMPDARKLNKRRRNYRIAVFAVLIMTPLTGFLTVAALNAIASAPKPIVPAAVLSSPGRAAAAVALDTWLNAHPSPLPGGRALLWSGVTSLPNPVSTTAAGAGPANPGPTQTGTEIDRFVVLAPDGATYEAALQVSLDSVGAASVIAGPSLTPIPRMGQAELLASNGTPWPGLVQASAADPVGTAVQAWATAFTGGDPAVLRQVVGDPANSHGYLPLSGIGAVTSTVGATATMAGGAKKDELVARVNFVSAALSPTSSSAQNPAAFTYDVLIDNASTAAPVVSAWGAPGTGPTLTPYINAFSASSDKPNIGSLHPTGLSGAQTTTSATAATAGGPVPTRSAPLSNVPTTASSPKTTAQHG